jgi:hypothetical protein
MEDHRLEAGITNPRPSNISHLYSISTISIRGLVIDPIKECSSLHKVGSWNLGYSANKALTRE